MDRAGCSSVVFDSTNRSRECGGATIVRSDGVEVDTAPNRAPKTSAIASRARWRRGLRWASELSLSSELSESDLARIGETSLLRIGLRLASRRVIVLRS